MKCKVILMMLLVLVSNSIAAADKLFPDKNIVKEFFQKTDVSISPVYGLFKEQDDYVATFHGFADNLANCNIFADIINYDNKVKFHCEKLNDGTLSTGK